MVIIEVKDKRGRRDFLEAAAVMYKEDPVWVRPLDGVIEQIFDPAFNNFHQHGEAARWVLKDDNERLCGRIAEIGRAHV